MPIAMDNSKESPRQNKLMCTMEIEAATMQTLPNGYLVQPGKSEIRIYEDQVPEVMALVQDEEEREAVIAAKKTYDRRFKKYADEKCGGDLELAYQRFPESVPSVFCQANEHKPGIRPLLSAVVKDKGLPPPHKEELWDASKNTADATVAAVEAIMNNPALRKMLEDKILNELVEKETPKSKKGN